MVRSTSPSLVFLLLLPCLFLQTLAVAEQSKVAVPYSATDPRFPYLLQAALDQPFLEGNKIQELVNGDQFFPAMLQAIRDAQHSITFENFIWRSGTITSRFVEALNERSRAGVKVHFLTDGLGSLKLKDHEVKQLRAAGIEVRKYNPPRLSKLFKMNHRSHRKTLVIDGKLGFLGGISMADDWMGNAETPIQWRDSNYRLEGPMVGQLQEIFLENWMESGGRPLSGEDYFPPLEMKGKVFAHCFKAGPGEAAGNARFVYMHALQAAEKHIRFAHTYFLPSDRAIDLLLEARKRGVKVEVLVPGIVNLNYVRRASISRWAKLLRAGVEFYEYQPSRYHCKALMIDDQFATFGSINFDERSFGINDEANFNVWDQDFVRAQIDSFERDKEKSRKVNSSAFVRRPWLDKCKDHFLGWFRAWL